MIVRIVAAIFCDRDDRDDHMQTRLKKKKVKTGGTEIDSKGPGTVSSPVVNI